MKPDPLIHKERQAIADELTRDMRHDVRNRLAAIRNAAFYLKRRASQTEVWTSDPRVQQFFKLIEDSVVHADGLLVAKFAAQAGAPSDARPTSGAAALRKGVHAARTSPVIRFEVETDDVEVYVDADELALAVRCLLERAATGCDGAGVVRVRGTRSPVGFSIEVSPWHEAVSADESEGLSPGEEWERGGDGLGVNIARRVARCYGGNLETSQDLADASITLTVPSAPPVGDPEAP